MNAIVRVLNNVILQRPQEVEACVAPRRGRIADSATVDIGVSEMPRFFFDLVDRDLVVEDMVGSELMDVTAARERAMALALGEVAQLKLSAEPYDLRELHVRVAAGQRVAKIAFRYVSA